ncbi:hypothetical protein F5144DRAFT_593297 [Chaetomium tenue]|uniref:Uncharacterized protein n=1 Tax=Chaetomium tenue TaxID=1854479 RepID=A0ACB7P8L1_9PEZI|nr:hypothetical protein F5144DRAFT_593297 [Chaetomium globosum]
MSSTKSSVNSRHRPISKDANAPGHPVYGVTLSPESIEDMASTGWPGSKIESIKPLEAGKSFNNKIYFLKIRHPALGVQDSVLKVNGTLYDGDKVQNEVACLRLLELYCPEVPAPRVMAWSEAGTQATFVSPNHAETKALGEGSAGNTAGWILTSRLPGKPVSTADLDAAAISSLAAQLADIVASWRQRIPFQKHGGSMQIRSTVTDNEGIALDRPCGPGIPDLVIRGILVEEMKLTDPITRIHDYYRLKLDNKLQLLESVDILERNRHLLEPLRKLRDERLLELSFSDIFTQTGTPADTFVFTHYDLFPRNILVSGESPPRVTGIVDWEFSGFFAPMDEFLDDWLDAGDWPEAFYTTFLKALEEKGVATPVGGVPGDGWHVAYWLERTIESAAPWWLLPGSLSAEQNEKALEKAESVVKEMLGNLGIV